MRDERVERYELALLDAMGMGDFPTDEAPLELQVLFTPTFHAPCAVRLTLAERWGVLIWAALPSGAGALFDAAWRRDWPALAGAAALARAGSPAEVAELDGPASSALLADLEALDPTALADVDLSSRDGIGVRCDVWHLGRRHAIHMASPTPQDSPRHARLAELALGAALARPGPPALAAALAAARGYLS